MTPRRVVALAAFILLAIAHTWPLASNPAHLSRNDSADAVLNTWAIAWVSHQLPRHPLHLFDGNIFYPNRGTLCYSEAMIVQGAMALPIVALGGSPVLAYNLVLLAGFALTGWAFCCLVQRWTGHWAAGYVSGSLAAFNAHVLVRLPHLQTQHVEFIAVMLFAVDRLIVSRRGRDALLLGVSFALQGLTSVYLLAFSTWALTFAVLSRPGEWARRDPAKALGLFAMAGIVASLLLGPYLAAYVNVHRATGFERELDEVQSHAGLWIDYLATGSRLHFGLWSRPFFRSAASTAFPGLTALALVGVAIAAPETRRDPRVRMCLIVALGCAAMSIVPTLPIYPVLHRHVPLFRAVRVPAHLSQIVLLMIAVVAGYGVAELARHWRGRRARPAIALAVVALVNLEALRAPLVYTPFTEVPPVYGVLATETNPVVLELPMFHPDQSYLGASYMLSSTRSWHRLVNGYSGFMPQSYRDLYDVLSTGSVEAALTAVRALGVTHIVTHEGEISPGDLDRLSAFGRIAPLEALASNGDIHVYRLK